MPCKCGNRDDRLIVHNGSIYRKKDRNGNVVVSTPGKRGAAIKRYLCTCCGYTSRGSSFGPVEKFPETEEEAVKVGMESPEDKERRENGNVVAKLCGRPDLVEGESR